MEQIYCVRNEKLLEEYKEESKRTKGIGLPEQPKELLQRSVATDRVIAFLKEKLKLRQAMDTCFNLGPSEVLLFYGTNVANAEKIVKEGFDMGRLGADIHSKGIRLVETLGQAGM